MAGDDNTTDNAVSDNGKRPDVGNNTTIAVYGMSAEGYELARRAAIDGATVFMVDESNLTAIKLSAEIARAYPLISSLQEDEPIIPIEPLHDAVAKAGYLFFTPRIRTDTYNTNFSMQTHFRDAVTPLKKGASVVFCAPVGFGGNSDYLNILQRSMGLDAGADIHYYYCPFDDGRSQSRLIGSTTDVKDDLLARLISPATTPQFVTLHTAEHSHALRVLRRFVDTCTVLDSAKLIPDSIRPDIPFDDPVRLIYLDSMVRGLQDMYAISESLEYQKALRRLVAVSSKAVESYLIWLVDETKRIAKDRGIRPVKSRLGIVWSFDSNFMRDDRAKMCNRLAGRLTDWMAEVEVFDELPSRFYDTERPVIVIACSLKDFEMVIASKKDVPNLLIIKANGICETFDD